MKNIKETINDSIDNRNESTKIHDQYHPEDTIRGYLSRHFIETSSHQRIFPKHPLLPEPYAKSREQMRKEMKMIQDKLENGEIGGIEALAKTVSLVDDYFNTLDAEEVKYISAITSECSRNDLYTDE